MWEESQIYKKKESSRYKSIRDGGGMGDWGALGANVTSFNVSWWLKFFQWLIFEPTTKIVLSFLAECLGVLFSLSLITISLCTLRVLFLGGCWASSLSPSSCIWRDFFWEKAECPLPAVSPTLLPSPPPLISWSSQCLFQQLLLCTHTFQT